MDKPLTPAQCLELRDLLFAPLFPTQERPFRRLAVLPGGGNNAQATVHYAFASPVWERAGYSDIDAGPFLDGLIADTAYASTKLQFQRHDYPREDWPIDWGLTAKESSDNFPLLILREVPGGKVTGALMRDSISSISDAHFASTCAEPEEALAEIFLLRSMAPGELYLRWYKESNIAPCLLEEAIAMTPETDAGQKSVLLYRDDEWVHGLWNNPKKSSVLSGIEFTSIADYHGTRVSAAKRESRAGIGEAILNQTLPGDYSVLESAIQLIDNDEQQNNEDHPALRRLCDWWNTNAPESMRYAGVIRVYYWIEADRTFLPGDPEEPARQADGLAQIPTYAIFERPGNLSVAVVFFKGRAHNTEYHGGALTYFANGESAWDIGLDLDLVDEAHYSIIGLNSLSQYGLAAIGEESRDA